MGADVKTKKIQIRQCVHEGKIPAAIEAVNELHPETLDRDTGLFFQLNIQHLVEIIRTGDMSAALGFARAELASLAAENPALLEKLEETMALLAFQDRSRSDGTLNLFTHSYMFICERP